MRRFAISQTPVKNHLFELMGKTHMDQSNNNNNNMGDNNRDCPISTRGTDLVLINKKKRTHQLMNFGVPGDQRIKESEKIEKYLEFTRNLKKLWNMKVTVIPIRVCVLKTVPQRPGKETGETEDQRKNQDHID